MMPATTIVPMPRAVRSACSSVREKAPACRFSTTTSPASGVSSATNAVLGEDAAKTGLSARAATLRT